MHLNEVFINDDGRAQKDDLVWTAAFVFQAFFKRFSSVFQAFFKRFSWHCCFRAVFVLNNDAFDRPTTGYGFTDSILKSGHHFFDSVPAPDNLS